MKRACMIAVMCMLGFALAFASGKSEAGGEGPKSITVNVNWPQTDIRFKSIAAIAADFVKANPGYQVEVVNPPDYENAMKTRMAANDLPDMWTTHGWSVMRYSEYLRPLNDRPWFSKINPLIKPVISDSSGKVYVLPMDVDLAGIAFNKDVLDEAGVDPSAIRTWDDFMAACRKVKAIGKIGVAVGGAANDNRWTVGNFFDWVAPSFLITNEKKNHRKALMDGSFDWTNWVPVARLLVAFRDQGFLNPDYTQGTWQDVGNQIAGGKAAFGLYGNYVIGVAKTINPNAHYGFMPVPASSADDSPSLISGEDAAVGIWKDDKAMTASLKFLDFLALPRNVNLVAKGSGIPTGLVGEGYVTDAGDLTPYFDKVKNLRSFPYFDRAYLPSGMWDTMCFTGTGMLADTLTPAQAAEQMKANYQSLMKK